MKDTVDLAAVDAHKGHTPGDRVAVAFSAEVTRRAWAFRPSARTFAWRLVVAQATVSQSARVGRDNAGDLDEFRTVGRSKLQCAKAMATEGNIGGP